jgi:hypothetical protein
MGPAACLLAELGVLSDPSDIGVKEDKVQLRKRFRDRFVLHRSEYYRREALI